MNLLNKHPFEIWQSPEVTELLKDFFVANYTWAGISDVQAEKFVLTAWRGKGIVETEVLRKESAELLLKIKENIINKTTEPEPLSLINLKEVEVFLDIGANRLAAINYFARRYPNVKKFIGVDVIKQNGSFVYPEKGEYHQVLAGSTSFPVETESVDLILIQYSLHHFQTEEEIRNTLNICHELLKPGGRLVLAE